MLAGTGLTPCCSISQVMDSGHLRVLVGLRGLLSSVCLHEMATVAASQELNLSKIATTSALD